MYKFIALITLLVAANALKFQGFTGTLNITNASYIQGQYYSNSPMYWDSSASSAWNVTSTDDATMTIGGDNFWNGYTLSCVLTQNVSVNLYGYAYWSFYVPLPSMGWIDPTQVLGASCSGNNSDNSYTANVTFNVLNAVGGVLIYNIGTQWISTSGSYSYNESDYESLIYLTSDVAAAALNTTIYSGINQVCNSTDLCFSGNWSLQGYTTVTYPYDSWTSWAYSQSSINITADTVSMTVAGVTTSYTSALIQCTAYNTPDVVTPLGIMEDCALTSSEANVSLSNIYYVITDDHMLWYAYSTYTNASAWNGILGSSIVYGSAMLMALVAFINLFI